MRKNEENIELLAVLMEAAGEIFSDPNVRTPIEGKGNYLDAINAALKGHQKACVNLLAAVEGEYPDDYIVPNPGVLLMKLVQLVNKPEVLSLFTLQGLNRIAASSGSATVNIKEKDKDGV